jgi:hypothetical protein
MTTDPTNVPCPFCFAKPNEKCMTRTGRPLDEYIHMQRKHEAHKGPRLALDSPSTPTEPMPSLELQVRAALNATLSLSETVTTLNTLLDGYQQRLEALEQRQRQFLVRQAVQAVLAGMDSDEPTFEDIWDLDEQLEGRSLKYIVVSPTEAVR